MMNVAFCLFIASAFKTPLWRKKKKKSWLLIKCCPYQLNWWLDLDDHQQRWVRIYELVGFQCDGSGEQMPDELECWRSLTCAVFPAAYQLRTCQPPPPVANATLLTDDDEFEIGLSYFISLVCVCRAPCVQAFTLWLTCFSSTKSEWGIEMDVSKVWIDLFSHLQKDCL